jgi:predicted secreted protein
MTARRGFTRRGVLAGLGAMALGARPVLGQQITDTRGFDPLWRNAEEAIFAFFGPVNYRRDGLHLKLPEHAEVGGSVPLTLRIDAAMTDADFPRVVHIMAHGNPAPHVMSAWFVPASGKAEFSTRIRLERTQKVTAVCQMSDGRHLRVDHDIAVSFGACAQIGTGTNDDVFAFKPQPRVNVPPVARRGDILAIRALISHPQETGLRLDGLEEWVRQRIISRFECFYNGTSVFRARLYPAIATNPYFAFFCRAEDSGEFEFTWFDMTNVTYTATAKLSVVA